MFLLSLRFVKRLDRGLDFLCFAAISALLLHTGDVLADFGVYDKFFVIPNTLASES